MKKMTEIEREHRRCSLIAAQRAPHIDESVSPDTKLPENMTALCGDERDDKNWETPAGKERFIKHMDDFERRACDILNEGFEDDVVIVDRLSQGLDPDDLSALKKWYQDSFIPDDRGRVFVGLDRPHLGPAIDPADAMSGVMRTIARP